MHKLNQFIKSIDSKIDELLSSWYPDNSTAKLEKKIEIHNWLSNREFSEQTDGEWRYVDAFRLLQEVELIQEKDIIAYIKKLTSHLTYYLRDNNIPTEKVVFYSFGESNADGGSEFIRKFVKDLDLRKQINAPQGHFKDCINSGFKALVFIDDFVGSGKTVKNFLKDNEMAIQACRNRQMKIIHLSLCCFEKHLPALNQEFDFADTARLLTERDQAFSPQSMIFQGEEVSRLRIEKWCKEIGEKLYSKGPLGYDDNQTLIVFADNAPNNSLPILWAGIRCESKDDLARRWIPVFPRINSEYKSSATPQADYGSEMYSKQIDEAPSYIQQVEIARLPMEAFLGNGHYTSAINILLGNLPFNLVDLKNKLEIIKIEQKAGYLEDARRHIDPLLKESYFNKLLPVYQAQVNLLDLRIASQEKKFPEVIENHPKVLSQIDQSLNQGFKCSVYHKTGIAYAVAGEKEKSRECFENSLLVSGDRIKHSNTTCRMYSSIANIFCGVKTNIKDPIAELVQCAEDYFFYPLDTTLWKFNGLKSSLQCLFAEAAVLLFQKRKDEGLLRLTAANLFAYYFKSDPRSEGYAELLAVIPEIPEKNLIVLAMQSDLASHNLYQQQVKSVYEYLIPLEGIVSKVGVSMSVDDWRTLRTILNKVDNGERFYEIH